ncbi:DUF6895 family protein [Halosaccharopolyspora lacisalsi]|uniref:DUF6895 family protein n=1 Tax=Halosaccharopolyspora lacisalsi TaxID=1000566 RepID=UPI0038B38EFF
MAPRGDSGRHRRVPGPVAARVDRRLDHGTALGPRGGTARGRCLPAHSVPRRGQLAALRGAQSDRGAMPAAGGLPTGDTNDVFDIVYHPTLVAVFASAMATSRALTGMTRTPS